MSQRNSFETSFSGESEEYSEAIVNFDGENGNINVDPSTKFPIKQLNSAFDSCATNNAKADDDQMRVFLRVRPSSGKNTDSTITVESETSIVTNAPENSKRAQYTKMEERHYSFTRVFGMEAAQEEVFKHSVQPLMSRYMNGDSVVFFAYGMTNAGKTHTIQGDKERPGVLPLLVEAVLNQLKNMTEWDLQTSMMEIYQDKIFDLLGKKKDKLSIRDGNGRVEVMKLTSHPIASAEDAIDLMNQAAVKRSKSNTFLNTGSSRSHAIYSLTLNRVIDGREVSAVFQVVDLAGAERGKRTMGTMTQQREANNINMSLMQLWRCLQAMQVARKDGKNGKEQIPFRESKLTHLLMPLLARVGLKGIAMLTCVNPQIDDYDETISILGNASLACQIKEITDLGRATTVGIVGQQSAPSNPADNIRAHRRIKRERESDDLNSRATAAVRNAAGRLRSVSNESQSSQASSSSTCVGGVVRGTKKGEKSVRIKREKGTEGERNQIEEDDGEGDFIEESLLGSELKRLRQEVRVLETENSSLMNAQLERETAIREEVAEEMADASAALLEQIRELQEQVDETTSHFRFDVTKSVKKAKKKHMQIHEEENSADMEEALKEMEKELDSVRENYEGQIDALTEEKERLIEELTEWKAKAGRIEKERDSLKEQLMEEKEKNANLVKAPDADEMPDLTVKVHEGTQTEPPEPSAAEVSEEVESGKEEDVQEETVDMDAEKVVDAPLITHLTQTSDCGSSQGDIGLIPDTSQGSETNAPSDQSTFSIFSSTENTANAVSTSEVDRDNIRSSIRSRTSSTSSLLHGDIIIGAPSMITAPSDSEEARKSAAAEFESRLKRDQRFKHSGHNDQIHEERQRGAEKSVQKSPTRSPGRSPLAPVENSPNTNGNVLGHGYSHGTNSSTVSAGASRTRTVYGKDGTISHVPMKEPQVLKKSTSHEDTKDAPTIGKKRLLSPMRSARNGNNENSAPKVFHTAKSRAREAALKLSPKPIKEEPLYGSNHPISKRLRNMRT